MNRRRVLIETSWNVKMTIAEISKKFSVVLIETSWNVKENDTPVQPELQIVLIETSWNVKCLPQTIRILRPHCINRNIVECKDF